MGKVCGCTTPCQTQRTLPHVAFGPSTQLEFGLAHLDQMYKLAEEERSCGNGPAVVSVHDELLRKPIASRTLEAARTRLLPTSVGRNLSGSNPPPVSPNDKAEEAAEADRIETFIMSLDVRDVYFS